MFKNRLTYVLIVLMVCTAAYVQGALIDRESISIEAAGGTQVFSGFLARVVSTTRDKITTTNIVPSSFAKAVPYSGDVETASTVSIATEGNKNLPTVKKAELHKLALPEWMKDLFSKEEVDEHVVQESMAAKLRQAALSGGSVMKKAAAAKDETPKPEPFAYRLHAFYPGRMGNNEPIRSSGLITDDIVQKVVGAPDFSIWGADEQKDKILSLGLGGIIVLEVQNGFLVDEEGPDLVVFENPFVVTGQQAQVYAETAIVSVALEDREDAYRAFPCNSKNSPYQGCAGVNPVLYHPSLPLNEIGGDLFDLKEVGLEKIKYIRIQDTGDHQALFPGKEGFDLDAIGLIHTQGIPVR